MLLGGLQEGYLACKNWMVGCWYGCVSGSSADLCMAQLMPLPLTVSCSSKSRLVLPPWFYLKFWCWLTRVVPGKIQSMCVSVNVLQLNNVAVATIHSSSDADPVPYDSCPVVHGWVHWSAGLVVHSNLLWWPTLQWCESAFFCLWQLSGMLLFAILIYFCSDMAGIFCWNILHSRCYWNKKRTIPRAPPTKPLNFDYSGWLGKYYCIVWHCRNRGLIAFLVELNKKIILNDL